MTGSRSTGDGGSALVKTGELVELARSGDEVALTDLFDRYGPALRSFLHARLSGASRRLLETEDLVQEVRIRALSNLDRFEYRGVGSFWAWVRSIAWNYVANANRRAGGPRAATSLPEESALAPAAEVPEAIAGLLEKEQIEAFESALESVSPKHREALLLRLELDQDYAFIAEQCDYPTPDAARMAVKRALEKVVRQMSDADA